MIASNTPNTKSATQWKTLAPFLAVPCRLAGIAEAAVCLREEEGDITAGTRLIP